MSSSVFSPEWTKSKARLAADLCFAVSLGLVLDTKIHGVAATLASATVTLALEGALRRKSQSFQCWLQQHTKLATVATMVALPTIGFLLGSQLPASWSDLRLTPSILGLVLGFEVRRSVGHAVVPELPDFAAHGRKARAFLTLALMLAPFLELAPTDTATYTVALAAGVLAHAGLRVFHRRVGLPPQKFSEAIRNGLSVAEDRALKHLVHPVWSLFPAPTPVDTFSGNLINAVHTFEDGDIIQANRSLKRAFDQAPDDAERAKPVVIEAAVAEALGDEELLSAKLKEARILYGNCTVATVAEILFAPDVSKPVRDSEHDLLRLLQAENVARTHRDCLTNTCVARVFGVNRLLFRVAKARAYFQLGNLNETADILNQVLSVAPKHGLARLHKGMELVQRRAKAKSDSERSDYFDIAVIQFELAIRYSPASSVTAKRAAEQLERLRRSPEALQLTSEPANETT